MIIFNFDIGIYIYLEVTGKGGIFSFAYGPIFGINHLWQVGYKYTPQSLY